MWHSSRLSPRRPFRSRLDNVGHMASMLHAPFRAFGAHLTYNLHPLHPSLVSLEVLNLASLARTSWITLPSWPSDALALFLTFSEHPTASPLDDREKYTRHTQQKVDPILFSPLQRKSHPIAINLARAQVFFDSEPSLFGHIARIVGLSKGARGVFRAQFGHHPAIREICRSIDLDLQEFQFLSDKPEAPKNPRMFCQPILTAKLTAMKISRHLPRHGTLDSFSH